MKLKISRSKNSCSFYVQKTIRRENGSTTTITVEKLGNLDAVKTKANGQDPYEWAQDYVNELTRKERDENKEILIRYRPNTIITKSEQKSYNIGYLFPQDVYYKLGLDRICNKIQEKYRIDYDLNDIFSKLIFSRILYPSSKHASNRLAKNFIEQPTFELHDIYRALSVLAKDSDYIQAELFKNSQKLITRRKDILYYDCTNFFFEMEEETGIKQYGKNKQHQPLPQVGMGLFIDHDGIPMAFDIFPGSKNEQPTLKPLEEKIINNYGLDQIIVCTDAGLSSMRNRKLNNKTIDGKRLRSFITTQSVKMLPEYLKEFALDVNGWHLPGSDKVYNIGSFNEDEEEAYFDKIFYKERWITENLTKKQLERGVKPLQQRLIVSYSLKYRNYQRKIREGQIERAENLIKSGQYKKRGKNQNDPRRFIYCEKVTENGETDLKEVAFIDTEAIMNEAQYDGFYAICSNLENESIEELIRINRQRWQIEECFRIMKTEFRARPVYLRNEDRIKAHFITCFIALTIYRLLEKKLGERFTCEEIIETLKNMNMNRPGEKLGYLPNYTRSDLTDALHENFGFRTDYEIINDINMKRIIRQTKGKK